MAAVNLFSYILTTPSSKSVVLISGIGCRGHHSKYITFDLLRHSHPPFLKMAAAKTSDSISPAFCALAATPETIDNWLCPLERLLLLLYDCTSSQEFVNGARQQFTQKGRTVFLRHKQYLSSTQSGLLTKPVNVNGGGTGMLMTAGQLFLKRHKLVVNYCARAALKVA